MDSQTPTGSDTAYLSCPNCSRLLAVKRYYAGRLMKCPNCGNPFQVPAELPETPTATESEPPKTAEAANGGEGSTGIAALPESAVNEPTPAFGTDQQIAPTPPDIGGAPAFATADEGGSASTPADTPQSVPNGSKLDSLVDSLASEMEAEAKRRDTYGIKEEPEDRGPTYAAEVDHRDLAEQIPDEKMAGIGDVFAGLVDQVTKTADALKVLTGSAGPLGAVIGRVQRVMEAFGLDRGSRERRGEAQRTATEATQAEDLAKQKRAAHQQAVAEADATPSGPGTAEKYRTAANAGREADEAERDAKAKRREAKQAAKAAGKDSSLGDVFPSLFGKGTGGSASTSAAGAGGAAASGEGAAAGAEAAGLAIPGVDVAVAGLMAVQVVGSALKGVFDSLVGTVTQTVAALNAFVDQAKPFVEAFAPSAILQLNQAVYDMQAAIGVALLPVVQQATDVFRDLGAMILPIAREAQDTFAQISAVVGGLVTSGFEALASTVEAVLPAVNALVEIMTPLVNATRAVFDGFMGMMLPMIRATADAFKFFQPLLQTINTIIEGLALEFQAVSAIVGAFMDTIREAITAILPSFDVTKELAPLKDAFRQLATQIVVVVATIGRFIEGMTTGTDRFYANLRKQFEGPKKEDATGLGAAKNAQTMSFASIGTELAKRASIAQGTAGAKTDDQTFREGVLNALGDVPTADTLENMIRDGIKDGVDTLVRELPAIIAGAVRDQATHVVGNAVSDVFDATDITGLGGLARRKLGI